MLNPGKFQQQSSGFSQVLKTTQLRE